MLSEGLYNTLVGTSALTALLGTSRGDGTSGVFHMLAPVEVTVPYVVYSQEGAYQVISFAGVNRLQRAQMRFGCYAASAKLCKQVANQVKLALGGLLGTDVAAAVTFEGAWLLMEADNVEAIPQGTIYSTHVDYEVWWADEASAGGVVILNAGALVAADFALSSGWGNTATVSAISGTGAAWDVTVTAGGTGIVANPTITLTFHAGSWGSIAPIGLSKIIGGTGQITDLNDVLTTTTWLVTYLSTPVAGKTYIISGLT